MMKNISEQESYLEYNISLEESGEILLVALFAKLGCIVLWYDALIKLMRKYLPILNYQLLVYFFDNKIIYPHFYTDFLSSYYNEYNFTKSFRCVVVFKQHAQLCNFEIVKKCLK